MGTAYEHLTYPTTAIRQAVHSEWGDNTVRVDPAILNAIDLVLPGEAAVLAMMARVGNIRHVGNAKYTVQEETPIRDMTTIASVTDTDTIVVASYLHIIGGQMILNIEKNVMARVEATPTSTTIELERSYATGGKEAVAWSVGDHILTLGTALEEGQDCVDAVARATGSHFNYAQEHQGKVMLTSLAKLQDYRGPAEWDRVMRQGVAHFKRGINKALILANEAVKGTGQAGSLPVFVNRGLRGYAEEFGQLIDLGTRLTLKGLKSALAHTAAVTGATKLTVLGGYRTAEDIGNLPEASNSIRTTRDDKGLGWEIKHVDFTGGSANIVVDRCLDSAGLPPMLFAFDMNYCGLAEFEPYTVSRIDQLGASRDAAEMHRRVGFECHRPDGIGMITYV